MEAMRLICVLVLGMTQMLTWYLLLAIGARVVMAMAQGENLVQKLADHWRELTDSLVSGIARRLEHIKDVEARCIMAWLYFIVLVVAANVVSCTLFEALPPYVPRAHRRPAATQPAMHSVATPAPGSMPAAPP